MFHEAHLASARVGTVSNGAAVCSPILDIPFFLQSAQILLSGCLTSSLRILAWRSVVARSAKGTGVK